MNQELIRKEFPVEGMTCAACAVSVESILKTTEGVKSARVNYAGNSAWVEFDEEVSPPNALAEAVQKIGYKLLIQSETKAETEARESGRLRELSRKVWISALFSLPVMVIGMFFMDMPYGNWIMLALSLPVLLYGGSEFFISAWKKLLHGQTSMDTLVATGSGAAFLLSLANTFFPDLLQSRGLEAHVYYESAAVIITLILLGRLLEERAKRQASAAIRNLMDLQVDEVRVLREGEERMIPLNAVVVGDEILIRPGERIPVDGSVLSGDSYVDESMISGEPVPLNKSAGDELVAGTLNQQGALRMQATKIGAETLLARIIEMVKSAQASKAPVQKLADRISAIFVPVVFGIAVLTGLIWTLFGPEPGLAYGLVTAITVLVIACPCALGLATPTAIMVGIGKGAKMGLLIKDAETLEIAMKTNVLVLDKTGTITEGKPKVGEVFWLNEEARNWSDALLGLENKSEHPLGAAIVAFLKSEGITGAEPEGFQSVTGRGIVGRTRGKDIAIGNEGLMKTCELKIDEAVLEFSQEMFGRGKTVVFAGWEGQVRAAFGIGDPVRDDSPEAIHQLKEQGMRIVMLTGDHERAAAFIAGEAGIEEFHAGLMPKDKLDFIQKWKKEGLTVAMVGDGINDSPALAASDIGIAMGTGTDIAMESARAVLTGGKIGSLPGLFRLSSATVRTTRQNLFWAFIYNLIGIPLAAGALYPLFSLLLNPMIAAGAMAFSSLSVVLNSLRLKMKKI